MKKLKNILHRTRWFLYIGFLILSIKWVGLYRAVISDDSDPSNNPGFRVAFTKVDINSREGRIEFQKKINILTDSILEVRKDQISSGDLYFYDEYISDLAQINLIEIQSGFAPNGSGHAMNNPLLELYSEAVRSGKTHAITEDEREIAENVYASITGVSGKIKYDTSEPFTWKDFTSWSLRKYLKFIPLILLLYLFWFFTDSKVSKFMRRNPLSFVLAVGFYPVVMFMIIRDLFVTKARALVAEADYRRTKDEFFSVLSKDEIGRIKAFASSSRKLFEWRRELKEEGRIFQHSFIVVLTFTIFFGFMFRATFVFAEGKSDQRTEIYQFVKEKTDDVYCYYIDFNLDDAILPEIIPWPRLLSQKIKFIQKIYVLENGFIPDIGHVPNSVSNQLLKTVLIY